MDRSDSLAELAKALSKFQGAMKSVPKTGANPYFHSKYADLDTIWETARKPLADNGLALVQTMLEAEGRIYLVTMLLHESGEYISSRYPLIPMRQAKDQGWTLSDDPQTMGSAITYARRYAMSAMLGISAEEDDDAEKSMGRKLSSARAGPEIRAAPAPMPGKVTETSASAPTAAPNWAAFWAGKDRTAIHAFFGVADRPRNIVLKAQALSVEWKVTLAEAVNRMRQMFEGATASIAKANTDIKAQVEQSGDAPNWFISPDPTTWDPPPPEEEGLL